MIGMNRWDDMEHPQYQADIYLYFEGGLDEWGNPLPVSKYKMIDTASVFGRPMHEQEINHFAAQGIEVDFQPLSGQRRVSSTGTGYESSHKLFILDSSLLERPIIEGMRVEVFRDSGFVGKFIVVFVEDYVHSLEIEVTRDA
jgi:hypothetical protein